jgi:hypothetical protein
MRASSKNKAIRDLLDSSPLIYEKEAPLLRKNR